MLRDFIYMAIGTFLFSLSITLFAMPNNLAEGGIVGLSLLLYFQFDLSPALVTFVFNAVLLLVGFKLLPKHMVYKSIINVPLLSLFIFFTERLGQPIEDTLLAAVFAGIITGVGFGFIFRAGSSTGGTSIIARMLNHRFGWELTGTNFVLDAVIVISGVFIIGPIYTMYTIIALYIGKKVTDYVLEGFDAKKAVNIISPEAQAISEKVLKQMASSATIFNGYGGYSKKEREVIYIVVRSYRLFYLKKLIHEVDPNAFIVVHNVKDVSGGTFFAATHDHPLDPTTMPDFEETQPQPELGK
ncbi:YitT family protein [Bacillus sp. Marseille-P3800]|uniref:YitT family protein n=1 Tax=Bacillus sp. Marseille-P3800 TaxID=2014782 RepID=UPI000C06FF97|nr:YitT family protein [Bacillus sp. Marseille-P3800]